MLAPRLSTVTRDFWRFLVDRAREFQVRRARHWELHASKSGPEARGLKLLREWLSPEQRAQFESEGYFDVVGCHSRSRIRYGSSANIDELDDAGVPRIGWCFVPNIYLVAGDVMLAQKIALETNERGALAVGRTVPPGLAASAVFYTVTLSRVLIAHSATSAQGQKADLTARQVELPLHPESGLRTDVAPCPSHLFVLLRGQR